MAALITRHNSRLLSVCSTADYLRATHKHSRVALFTYPRLGDGGGLFIATLSTSLDPFVAGAPWLTLARNTPGSYGVSLVHFFSSSARVNYLFVLEMKLTFFSLLFFFRFFVEALAL